MKQWYKAFAENYGPPVHRIMYTAMFCCLCAERGCPTAFGVCQGAEVNAANKASHVLWGQGAEGPGATVGLLMCVAVDYLP